MWTEITRPKYERKGLVYSSDLSDPEWAIIEPRLPQRNRLGRPPKTELRRVVNTLLYMVRTGCQWRQLPREFPPYTTVQHYFYAWRDSGVLERINFELLLQARAKRPAASQAPRLALSIANRSRPPRPAARAVLMRQRKSTAASDMSSPTQPACWSEPKCIRPTGKTATVLRSSSPPFTISFPGCDISSPTAPMPGTSCSIPSPNSATGRSRSCVARPMPSVLRSSRAAGSSNALLPGSTETAASPKTSRRRSPAPRLGSTSPRSSSLLGDWRGPDATYTILSRTLSARRHYATENRYRCGPLTLFQHKRRNDQVPV